MIGDSLIRLTERLIPPSWRSSVSRDLEEEARLQRRGSIWRVWQTAVAAAQLRRVFIGDPLMWDIKYVVRSLMRAKGFTLAAVLTLVLGIGVNVAVFTIVDRALFRPLPFGAIDRLVTVKPYDPETGARYTRFSKRLFVEARHSLDAIDDLAFVGSTYGHSVGDEPGAPVALALTEASFNVLDVLAIAPVFGRGFLRDDAVAKRGVALITFETWHGRFAGSHAIVGREVQYGKQARTIIGVLPKGFIAPAATRARRFDGLFLAADLIDTAGPREGVWPGVARLAPGASVAVAQQQIDALAIRLDPELRLPGQRQGPRVVIEPIRSGMFWREQRYLWLVTLGATFVGLLACANFSNLLLARGRSREQQLALRASLGASAGRLLATELVQSAIICTAAAAISLLILVWTAEGIKALVPSNFRPFVLGAIDMRVVGFAVLAAVIASLVAGLWPAWQASRAGLVTVLQRGAGTPVHARRSRVGSAVLAFETAVGIVLVAGAAGIVRSFVGLLATDVGFVPAGMHVLKVQPTASRRGSDRAAALARAREILEVIRQQPAVAAAAGVDSMPAAGMAAMTGFQNESGSFGLWQMTDGFLSTIGARIVAGQDITKAEVDAARPVAVVTQSAARRLFPGVDDRAVVGREIVAPKQPARQVIGIISDVRDSPISPPEPRVFIPVTPDEFWSLDYAVRPRGATLDVDSLRKSLTRLGVTSVSAAVAGESITSSLQGPRVQALMFGSFAVIGLLLAALGLFAVASFDVALRRYELGVRVMLGATARQIRRLVIGDALRPVALGVIVGLIAAYWTGEFVQSLVHQVDARDPWTLALVSATLLLASILAVWLPARRAARIDPAVTLRAQ